MKQKNYKISAYALCLENISKDWSVDNIAKTGLKGYYYNFSVNYDAIVVSDISCIHKYLMKKNETV